MRSLTLLAICLSMTACAADTDAGRADADLAPGESAATTTDDGAPPAETNVDVVPVELVATTTDAEMVFGSSSCEMLSDSTTWADGRAVIVEAFECDQQMSDPRASGVEVSTTTSWGIGRGGGGTWISDDAVLTNDDGAWRGAAYGVYAKVDRLPSVDSNERFYTWGVSRYLGEGAYEGLELVTYSSGTVSQPAIAGWIGPVEPSG